MRLAVSLFARSAGYYPHSCQKGARCAPPFWISPRLVALPRHRAVVSAIETSAVSSRSGGAFLPLPRPTQTIVSPLDPDHRDCRWNATRSGCHPWTHTMLSAHGGGLGGFGDPLEPHRAGRDFALLLHLCRQPFADWIPPAHWRRVGSAVLGVAPLWAKLAEKVAVSRTAPIMIGALQFYPGQGAPSGKYCSW